MTARTAQRLGVKTVVGFTGSSIWKYVAMFPPAPEEMVAAGYRDFADRWNPILDVFDEVGVRFAHEVHPSEIAYDYWTAVRALEAVGRGESLLDPAVTERVLQRVRQLATGEVHDELSSLTQQERKILLLVAEGKTNKEIASDVFLSDKTVKNYVSSILAKLSLERRAQAAAFVAKHRLDGG